ncbi:MAG: ABC transporter permease subunit [Gammaproteobacteria bacterium]|nr:ABC transporter permease subunit [Gammaproteobacteria bacterium]MYD76075.1 ABC transporter permease subunit [Gammaproteobacteria bacterium]MYJ52166.1 ABC transporter permease subunit [Gammaproteobacteria bacterium]
MIVAILYIALLITLVWSIVHGRKIIRTERTDAVFGNPIRTQGGYHWVACGVSSLLLIWFTFSWDAGRAFFPKAANELCQVAKLNRALNPVRSAFPLDNRYLLGTQLLERDFHQIDLLYASLDGLDLDETDRRNLRELIDDLRRALASQADPAFLAPDIAGRFRDVAVRIEQLATDILRDDYPGPVDEAARAEALAQPGWGESSTEIPVLPITERGRIFDAAAVIMGEIASDYGKIRNNGPELTAMIEDIRSRIEEFEAGTTGDGERKELLGQIEKISKRVDDFKIFPANLTEEVESALIRLEKAMKERQGTLRLIDAWALPGGDILAGNKACSEQGSGRWLPKPSDTLSTFIWMADPDQGYKGFPLFWFKMKPVAEMIDFAVPDWIADLVPGEHARHDDRGEIGVHLKDRIYNFATGSFDSFSIPVPTGHIWDSIMRVLAGLFLGILLGVPLGLFMGLSRFAKGYFDPLVELYRPVPPLAWAPLILTIFGIQDDGKIFLLFMVAFAIMVISARTGATGTQLSKIHAAHSLGASNRQIIQQVILPNSLPEILTGIRISIGVCWGTLVAAEMLAGTTGIGFVENVARKQSDYEIIWMTIIVMGVLGLLFDLIMRWVIDKTIPWRGKG